MPRLDRTYTAADLIRFWANNLNKREQNELKSFFGFLFGSRRIGFSAFTNILGSAIGIVPVVGDAVEFTLDLVEIISDLDDLSQNVRISRKAIKDSGIPRKDLIALFRAL